MFYGVRGGFIRFRPDDIRPNLQIPPVVLTTLRLFNKPGAKGESAGDTTFRITYFNDIKLKYSQNDFAISFSALNYLEPEKNQYQYRLLGYQKQWIITDASHRTAAYTNLPPKTYTFQVKGTNNDGFWNEKATSLTITIHPPWYWTGWSKTLYALIVLGILYLFYRFQLKRRLAAAEAQRLQELDTFKTRLYTNITHEFRTPLTVISGMADQVLENPKDWFREGLRMIKRNSRQLLRLVNQQQLTACKALKKPSNWYLISSSATS